MPMDSGPTSPGSPPASGTGGEAAIRACLQTQASALLKTICWYVFSAGLASDTAVQDVAEEVLQEAAAVALERADHYVPVRGPGAWLLGIAAKLILRRQAARARDARPLPAEGWLTGSSGTDGLAFDQALANDERADEMLARVSPDDRRILSLAVLHDAAGATLAQELGISPVAARVRLHRAIDRLRAAHADGTKGGDNERA